MSVSLETLADALAGHGLFLRGGVGDFPAGAAPRLADGSAAASVLLVGPIGGSLWPMFAHWRARAGAVADPLDSWSKAVIGPLAERFGATAWYPSDPPYQPFQRWAMAAEGLSASPLGILIHPHYGIWHSYRAALGFAEPLACDPPPPAAHPCLSCRAKPCLTRCPVGAVEPDRFDVPACRAHLRSAAGKAGCMTTGCAARNACPVGEAYRYAATQMAFHMAALEP